MKSEKEASFAQDFVVQHSTTSDRATGFFYTATLTPITTTTTSYSKHFGEFDFHVEFEWNEFVLGSAAERISPLEQYNTETWVQERHENAIQKYCRVGASNLQ